MGNEKVVEATGCSESGCTIDNLNSIIQDRADGCHYDALCENYPKIDNTTNILEISLALLLAILLCESTYIFFHCYKKVQTENISIHNINKSQLKPLINDDNSSTESIDNETINEDLITN